MPLRPHRQNYSFMMLPGFRGRCVDFTGSISDGLGITKVFSDLSNDMEEFLQRRNISKSVIEEIISQKEALKAMRKPDDIIINTINSTVPTDSFHTDPVEACKSLHETLENGYIRRENYIKNCITITTDRIKRLKEQKEQNSDDIQLSKQLRSDQTTLRLLQVELTVEDLIRQRTAKVFNERCRTFYKPL